MHTTSCQWQVFLQWRILFPALTFRLAVFGRESSSTPVVWIASRRVAFRQLSWSRRRERKSESLWWTEGESVIARAFGRA